MVRRWRGVGVEGAQEPAQRLGRIERGPGVGAADVGVEQPDRIVVWDAEMNGAGARLWIEVHRAGSEPQTDAMVLVYRSGNQIVVGRSPADAHAG